MYAFLSILATLSTAFMFLRMHHVHGSDTTMEKIIIIIGCIIFLIQAGFAYQVTTTQKQKIKGGLMSINVGLLFLFSILFFWFVDFQRDSIFSTLLGEFASQF